MPFTFLNALKSRTKKAPRFSRMVRLKMIGWIYCGKPQKKSFGCKDRTNFLKNKKMPDFSLRNFVDSDYMLNFAALKLKTVLEERDLRDLHVGTRYISQYWL